MWFTSCSTNRGLLCVQGRAGEGEGGKMFGEGCQTIYWNDVFTFLRVMYLA